MSEISLNNISHQIAYKLQDKIGKVLRTQADAIQHTLDAYNTAAAQLNLPCENLTYGCDNFG